MTVAKTSSQRAALLCVAMPLFCGCHTFEVRQYESVRSDRPKRMNRVAVIMATEKTLEGDRTKDLNKLFTEQLIVSFQQRGVDVAERQMVETLLIDSALVESGEADLTETERAKRLGRLLKVDAIVYGDAIVNVTHYTYFRRFFFNNNSERIRLQNEANNSNIVKRNGYPVLAQHSIGLSARAVDTATGEIIWVGYRSLASAKWVKDNAPNTLTNFDVIQQVCDEVSDDLLSGKM